MRVNAITAKAVALLLVAACAFMLAGCGGNPASESGDNREAPQAAIAIKVLILPHFEIGEMSGDRAGEAQHYYEEYLQGGDEYDIRGMPSDAKLFLKDGTALCLTGQGKVNTALTISAVLSDKRFDFSDAYVIAVGCAGAARDYGVFGDVYVISAAADYDLGHHADTRDQSDDRPITWYRNAEYDKIACTVLNQELTDTVFGLVKDTPLETTEKASETLKESFPGEEWATRPPQVLKGTSVTSDNYWKGVYDHQNALLITQTYGCPDPFAATEMEDIAVCRALKSYDMLDRLIILRTAVNMDVFTLNTTPESLWGPTADDNLASDTNKESVGFFDSAMHNNFAVGKTVIQAILDGKLRPRAFIADNA